MSRSVSFVIRCWWKAVRSGAWLGSWGFHDVEGAEPVRREAGPRVRPAWEKVGPRIEVLLEESKGWTGGTQ